MKKPNDKDKKYHRAYGGFDTARWLVDQAEWDAEQRAKSEARYGVKAVIDTHKRTTIPSGTTSNYYGGKGKADGPGHSHTKVDNSTGNVVFHREGGKPNK